MASPFAGLVTNPYFWLIVIPLFAYFFIIILVKAKGSPVFARKWPIASRFYDIEIPVLEKRMGGLRWTKTFGRMVEQTAKWHIIETQDFGNMMVPKLSCIIHDRKGRDVIPMYSPEKGEYHPIEGIEELKVYEENLIPRKDAQGNVMKDEMGKEIMIAVKKYLYKPFTQSQRIFRVAEDEESKMKYSKALTFWDKILPYVGLILLGAFVIIGCALVLQNMGGISDNMAQIAQQLASQQNINLPPVTNATW